VELCAHVGVDLQAGEECMGLLVGVFRVNGNVKTPRKSNEIDVAPL
jgi:hypothetical protein